MANLSTSSNIPPPTLPPSADKSNEQALATALSATLSNDAAERQAAEALLSHLAAHDEHHALHLLHLSTAHHSVVAPAAALRLKNLVRNLRIASPILPDQSRVSIREHILTALSMCRATPVEGILSEVMHWLVISDFPSRWPNLLQQISQFLSSGNATKVHAALVALRQIVKCYEFKTRDANRLSHTDPNDMGLLHPRQPLETIAQLTFPTLLNLYVHLDAIVTNEMDEKERNHAAIAQRFIVKIFWSCTHFILPPCLAEPESLDGWMNALLSTLSRPCRYVNTNDDEDELNSVPEWKTKKWIASVLNRFLKRYGSPKKVPVDEPWAKTIAQSFKSRYAETATKVMLQVLTSTSSSLPSPSTASPNQNDPQPKQPTQQISKRVAHLAFDFVEEAIETAQLWVVIKPHVDTLLTKVVFSYLSFSDNDEELWHNDPGEYVRKQYDCTEDLTSPRMAAANLLTKMADLRSKSTILPFLQYLVQVVLDPYKVHESKELARLKVGAFAALAAVRVKLVSKQELSDGLMSVLKNHVIPDLQSKYGFLRSEAAWLLGQIASCGWDEFEKEIGQTVLRGCVGLLEDSYIPVQASAAGALQFLMGQDGGSNNNESNKSLIEPVAPQLLERLLQLMDRMNEGYSSLLPAVDKLVERYPEKIIPVSIPLMQRLICAFRQCAEGILKDGDDDDDDLVFTAAQVLHLISSVLSCIGECQQSHSHSKQNEENNKEERGKLICLLEKELECLLENTFEENHQVFVEELLDVLGILIVQIGEINNRISSTFLLSLIPKMLYAFNHWAADYIEQMMDSIEGYVTFGLIDLCNMNHNNEKLIYCLIGMVEKLLSDKFDPTEAEFGSKIAEWIILNLGKVKSQHPTLIDDAVSKDIVLRLSRYTADRLLKCNNDINIISSKLANSNDNGGDDDDDFSDYIAREKICIIKLSERLFCVLMDCCHVDAEGVLKGLGVQWMMQLIGQKTSEIDLECNGNHGEGSSIGGGGGIVEKFERAYAKKSVMLGLCGILCTKGMVMEESKPHLVRLLVGFQQKLEKQRKDAETKRDIIEISGSDGSKLKKKIGSSSGGSPISIGNGNIASGMLASPFVELIGSGVDGGGGGVGSDLDDDEDATNLVDDIINERQQQMELQRLANNITGEGGNSNNKEMKEFAGLGMNNEQVSELMNGSCSAGAEHKIRSSDPLDYFDMLECNQDDEDDEILGVGVHVLDEIDEVAHLVKCVKMTAGDHWWPAVSEHDRLVLDNLARRVDMQFQQQQEQFRTLQQHSGATRRGNSGGGGGG